MRRFDRAIYAVFLLVLLADVARAHALTPVGSDMASGLMLDAASQIPATSGGAAILALRRSDGSLAPIARWKSSSFALSQWSRILSRHSRPLQIAKLVVLPASISWLSTDSDTSLIFLPSSASPALAIFEHASSRAP